MTALDMTESLAPNSDQLDAIDLITGPREFTITNVTKGSADQPFNFHLAEFDRPWRPGKSMRRVIVACWGPKTDVYHGRSLKLWCDPRIKFGPDEVGGVRILALSHIENSRSIPLLVSRGKTAPYRVDVLKVEPKKADEQTVARLTDLLERKGVPQNEWPDLTSATVDEARDLWRSLSARPDAQQQTSAPEVAERQQAALDSWGDQ